MSDLEKKKKSRKEGGGPHEVLLFYVKFIYIKEGLSEEVPFEQKPVEDEGGSYECVGDGPGGMACAKALR